MVCTRFPGYASLAPIPGFGPAKVLKLAGLDLSRDRSGKKTDTVIVI